MTLPLKLIRIVDVTQTGRADLDAAVCAWFGADVLNVERVGGGDINRHQLRDIPDADALYFTQRMGFAWMEFFGSLSLLFGLLFCVAAPRHHHRSDRSGINDPYSQRLLHELEGTQKGEEFEYHIIAVPLALLILVRDSGAVSIDHLVSSRDSSRNG
jgi:hypothetical protein